MGAHIFGEVAAVTSELICVEQRADAVGASEVEIAGESLCWQSTRQLQANLVYANDDETARRPLLGEPTSPQTDSLQETQRSGSDREPGEDHLAREFLAEIQRIGEEQQTRNDRPPTHEHARAGGRKVRQRSLPSRGHIWQSEAAE